MMKYFKNLNRAEEYNSCNKMTPEGFNSRLHDSEQWISNQKTEQWKSLKLIRKKLKKNADGLRAL